MADPGMADHDAACIGGWAISGLLTLATILSLWHFQIRARVESVSSATCRACDARSWSRGILFGSICCGPKENLHLPGR